MKHCKKEAYNIQWNIHAVTRQLIKFSGGGFNEINVMMKRLLKGDFIPKDKYKDRSTTFCFWLGKKMQWVSHKSLTRFTCDPLYFPKKNNENIVLQSLTNNNKFLIKFTCYIHITFNMTVRCPKHRGITNIYLVGDVSPGVEWTFWGRTAQGGGIGTSDRPRGAAGRPSDS